MASTHQTPGCLAGSRKVLPALAAGLLAACGGDPARAEKQAETQQKAARDQPGPAPPAGPDCEDVGD
jgi:uncharacterized lipoprotein